MPRTPPKDIDAYIVASPAAVRPILQAIRKTIADQVPEATEIISYQMPAFRLKKVFIFFAAFKKHIGFYPPLRGTAGSKLDKALKPFRGEKGNLKFPLDQPLDLDLIGQLAKALATQSGQKG